MGCCECKWIRKIILKDEENKKEKEYFNRLKTGLQESMNNINETLKPIENWDKLLDLNSLEEFNEEIVDINKTNISRSLSVAYNISSVDNKIKDFYSFWSDVCRKLKNYKYCPITCFIFGCFFCLIHLIGVQEGIIILNALFDEIVDEFKLLANDTPKEFNFYEKIENATYKSIPEIDVGMFWSFLGIIFLKKYGFMWSNIFQLLSLIGFLLLFLLFDFHTGDKLSINYEHMELTILILSYILLSILVGATSMLSLKQLMNLYNAFYKKHFNLYSSINIYYRIFYHCVIKETEKEKKSKKEENILNNHPLTKLLKRRR